MNNLQYPYYPSSISEPEVEVEYARPKTYIHLTFKKEAVAIIAVVSAAIGLVGGIYIAKKFL